MSWVVHHKLEMVETGNRRINLEIFAEGGNESLDCFQVGENGDEMTTLGDSRKNQNKSRALEGYRLRDWVSGFPGSRSTPCHLQAPFVQTSLFTCSWTTWMSLTVQSVPFRSSIKPNSDSVSLLKRFLTTLVDVIFPPEFLERLLTCVTHLAAVISFLAWWLFFYITMS